MNKTLRNRIAIASGALLAVAAVLMLTPGAEAQGGSPNQFAAVFSITNIDAPDTALKPDGVPGVIKVSWEYSFPNQAVTANQALAGATTLNFSPAPSCNQVGFIITGPTTIPIAIPAPGPTTPPKTGTSNFQIVATSDAPGETPVECTFGAFVEGWGQGAQVPRAVAQPVKVSVQAAYLGLVSASVPVTIDEAGPQKQITYAIKLQNLGNSRTFVNFRVTEGTYTEEWKPVAPTQISLESKNQGGTRTAEDAFFLISTPYQNGWNNDETTFQLIIQPQSTKDPALTGNEVTVNFLARVRGIYVPGPEPLLLVGAIVGSALVLRLRRSD